jgi:hypothetical protein
MRYRLRTLMIVLALGPPLVALTWLEVANPGYVWYLMLTTLPPLWLLEVAALVTVAVASVIFVANAHDWLRNRSEH